MRLRFDHCAIPGNKFLALLRRESFLKVSPKGPEPVIE